MARSFLSASSQSLSLAMAPPARPFTMACWFNPTDTTGRGLLSFDDGSANNQYSLQTASSKVAAARLQAAAFTSAQSTTTYAAGSYAHACGVWFSNVDTRAYLNGGGRGNDAVNNTPGACTNFKVANQLGYVTYNGLLCEVAIWTVALTDTEVAMLAAGVAPWMIHPEALLEYWPVFGAVSPEPGLIKSNNLTLNNAPLVAVHAPIRYRGYK